LAAEAGRRLAAALLACAVAAGCAHSTYGDPAVAVAGRVLGMAVHTRDAEELRYVVLHELTDRYAQEQGIAVTQAEKDAYVSYVREGLAKDRAQKAARRAELAARLAAGGLSDAERSRLAAEVAALDDFLAALDDAGAAKVDPQEEEARQQVAAAFILQWKINRSLYREYGGRIIFQQGGPEPLDAYRRFLEQAQSRGDFRIVDKSLEAAFWRYYRDDSIHSFYPRGSKEEAQAFAVAPWAPAGIGGGPR
jgi:ABC-type glycerol-3-phosphate transport system substrate-binding protein